MNSARMEGHQRLRARKLGRGSRHILAAFQTSDVLVPVESIVPASLSCPGQETRSSGGRHTVDFNFSNSSFLRQDSHIVSETSRISEITSVFRSKSCLLFCMRSGFRYRVLENAGYIRPPRGEGGAVTSQGFLHRKMVFPPRVAGYYHLCQNTPRVSIIDEESRD